MTHKTRNENMGYELDNLTDYLLYTKSAVTKIFSAYDSYLSLMKHPERPVFTSKNKFDSVEYKNEFQQWIKENELIIKRRIKNDNKFTFENFARATLMGTVLQFAFWAINSFSKNTTVPADFPGIQEKSNTAKFCIGRLYDNIPIGLIIYAGRNQAMHLNEKPHKVTIDVFEKLANSYDPISKKHYKSDYFDLNNKNNINCAESITYVLGWRDYDYYESELKSILS